VRRAGFPRLPGFAAVALVSLATAAPSPAAECPKTTLGDIEDEVMCPICGTPLALATEAPQAQRERAYIQRLIDDCRSKEEVKRALVAQFGEQVLALPGDEEEDDLADVAAYAVPALAIMLGTAAITIAALRWRRRRTSFALVDEGGDGREGGDAAGVREPRRPRPPSDAAEARLESDIDRYDL
jgi:cytochrome c-type biogenesis protein CcmH